jgi:hypothetical protein
MTTTGSLTIVAINGGTIDINSLTEILTTGVFDVTGSSTTTFHADALTDADGAITVTAIGAFHLPALTAHGAIDVSATTAVALSSLVTSTATIDLNSTPAAILTDFVEAAHTLTWNIGVINLPNVNLDVPMSTTATNVTIKSFDVIGDVGTSVTRLVLTGQDVDLGGTSNVTDLTVTADGSGVDCTLAGALLTDVSLSGTEVNSFDAALVVLKNITLNDTATNTLNNGAGTVTQTVNLTGTVMAFTSDATTLAAFNNSANYLDVAPPAATPITIDIEASALTSVDLSAMEKVAVIRFVNNSALTSLTAPSGANNLLTPGGGPTITVTGNSITATYTGATAAFAGDGVNPPTAYEPACIYSPSLASIKDYITAVSAVDTVTYTLDAKFGTTADGYGEELVNDNVQTHHDGTAGGGANADTINNSEVGLSLVQATACN